MRQNLITYTIQNIAHLALPYIAHAVFDDTDHNAFFFYGIIHLRHAQQLFTEHGAPHLNKTLLATRQDGCLKRNTQRLRKECRYRIPVRQATDHSGPRYVHDKCPKHILPLWI